MINGRKLDFSNAVLHVSVKGRSSHAPKGRDTLDAIRQRRAIFQPFFES
jgi:hypothetical protein